MFERFTDTARRVVVLAQEEARVHGHAGIGLADPLIGRETELLRVMQILTRRTKNNPVLVGEPGVGKTAIVEGLAQRIAAGAVARSLARRQAAVPHRPGRPGGRHAFPR